MAFIAALLLGGVLCSTLGWRDAAADHMRETMAVDGASRPRSGRL
jgi:hypothetical protein